MTDLLAARSQMAISLGFHIVFAAIGTAMPFLMAFSLRRWIKTQDPVYRELTSVWSKGVAIFFAVGAVSGTVLSFELGLLWPRFMELAGPIIGMPFSWEGAAFFLEAIALGIFLYGWGRVPPRVLWASALIVGMSGVLSGLFVICANGWMNSPAGFIWVNGRAENIDPWAAMFNPAAWGQGLHMTIAAFSATGFAAAGIHAWALLKNKRADFHRRAYHIALTMGAAASLIQPLTGHRIAQAVAVRQPLKLAAMESLAKTQRNAPIEIGGVKVPGALSFLAHGDFHSEVQGLDAFPREDWPPVKATHLSFDLMVALGSALALLSALYFYAVAAKKPWPESRIFLKAVVVAAPLGFLAIEAGWAVTEIGRQPWIIYNVLRTRDALTPMPGLVVPMTLFTVVYIGLALTVAWLMTRQFRRVG